MNKSKEEIPRILVFGSSGHGQLVTSYLWKYIPKGINLADYDVLIMDFTSFEIKAISKGVDLDKLPSYKSFARLLFSPGSEIIILGSPNFKFGSNPYMKSLFWLPLAPVFNIESGETINLKNDDYKFYFDYVDSWSFCVANKPPEWNSYSQEYLFEGGITSPPEFFNPKITSIAENRYKLSIAFKLIYEYRVNKNFNTTSDVIWLPAPTKAITQEVINLIIRERYGIYKTKEAPNWLANYNLPNEAPIREELNFLEKNISDLKGKLVSLEKDLVDETRFKKLLYETGEGVLEPIVRDGLRFLGADVTEPTDRGKEDGRLISPSGQEGTLEIKGRAGNLRLRDINELDRWVRNSLIEEGRKSKGLLISNLQRDKDPRIRKDFYPPNCLNAANNSNIALISTTQLFKAIQLHQKNELDIDKFWKEIFKSNGPCKLLDL